MKTPRKFLVATLDVEFELMEEMTETEAFNFVMNAKIEIEKMAYRGLRVEDLEVTEVES